MKDTAGDKIKMTDVIQRVMEIVAKGFGETIDNLTPGTRFVEDLDESLELQEVVMDCEEAFGRSIPDEEAVQLLTIGLLASYIEGRLQVDPTVWPPPPRMPDTEDRSKKASR